MERSYLQSVALQTERLLMRPLAMDDLQDIHHILDVELAEVNWGEHDETKAFSTLKLKRIVATTTYDNAALMGVMRKLGMRIERNPMSEPLWFQVVGILENNCEAS